MTEGELTEGELTEGELTEAQLSDVSPSDGRLSDVRWELSRHASRIGMAQLPVDAPLPSWALDSTAAFTSMQRTVDELTVICEWSVIPEGVPLVGPFAAFSIDGPLDHSLIGVLAGLLTPLAVADISVLAESTYNTDWILIPDDQADQAVGVWTAAGHTVYTDDHELDRASGGAR